MPVTVGVFIRGLPWAQYWPGEMESDETDRRGLQEIAESGVAGKKTNVKIPHLSKTGPENNRRNRSS